MALIGGLLFQVFFKQTERQWSATIQKVQAQRPQNQANDVTELSLSLIAGIQPSDTSICAPVIIHFVPHHVYGNRTDTNTTSHPLLFNWHRISTTNIVIQV